MASWLAVWTVCGADSGWHTSPDKWAEPRIFHRPFDDQFAANITVERCVIGEPLPERKLAPNDAYWFALIEPDRTKGGPWSSEVLIYTERDYLVRIRLRDVHWFNDIGWVNEKLLRLRVWWGRVCATDLIFDVERERIVYREMVWDGVIPFQQYQEAKGTSQKTTDVSKQVRVETNRAASQPVQPTADVLPARPLLISQAGTGMTYEIGVYVVKQGDNLLPIAQRHGLRIRDLVELNPELADSSLTVGQQIRVYERLKD